MTLGQFAQLAEIVGVSVVVVGAAVGAGAWAWRAGGRIRAAFDRASRAIDRIEVLARELGDNGGQSIKDAVMQTRRLVLLVNARQVALRHALEVPLFETDAAGQTVAVNVAFERVTGYAGADLVGLGWVNLIDSPDRDLYVHEWDQAVRDRRAFPARRVVYRTAGGRSLSVVVTAQTMIAGDEVLGWFGRVEVEGAA